MEKKAQANPDFVNPIDPDKIAENPHLLPYAHQVGSAVIKPEDQGKLKGRALSAMSNKPICSWGKFMSKCNCSLHRPKNFKIAKKFQPSFTKQKCALNR